jgi:hypothetical protein
MKKGFCQLRKWGLGCEKDLRSAAVPDDADACLHIGTW